MFLVANIIGTSLLGILGLLAFFTFSGYTNPCMEKFPCRVESMFNYNFMNLPVIGSLINFYPMLNIAAVPILTITLRNNLLEALPLKRWFGGGCLSFMFLVRINTFNEIRIIIAL